MDFFEISRTETNHRDGTELTLAPSFQVNPSKELMIRGGVFYAIWDEEKGLWSQNEIDVSRIVDKELHAEASKVDRDRYTKVHLKTMRNYSSNSWSVWKKFVKQRPDSFVELDRSLTFANTPLGVREEYRSKQLPYALTEGDYSAWDKLVSTLYAPEERQKIEWAIGSVVSGDSKTIEKFLVLYGEGGTGKSTIIKIIKNLFKDYTATIDAQAIVSKGNSFSSSALKSHPLVAVQPDTKLDKIDDNSKLNTIVAHEETGVNEKYEKEYMTLPECLIILGSNSPVEITDAKSGLIRRLIDVEPTGKLIPNREYNELMDQIKFQLGAIAYHCLEVYRRLGKHHYDKYKPLKMLYKTNVFFNFVEDSYDEFSKGEGVTLKQAYTMYKEYCEDSFLKPMVMYKFREELKNYFEEYLPTKRIDGKQYRSYFQGFKAYKFDEVIPSEKDLEKETPSWLSFDSEESLFDAVLADYPAQYAPEETGFFLTWDRVKTRTKDLDSKLLHHVNIPVEAGIITIDFDIADENGNKCLEKNIEAASKWTPTYAELSKSGQGIHLEYYWDGDQSKLSAVFAPGIEIKTCVGDSSLRRKVTRCNNIPLTKLSSGLPLKEEKMIDFEGIENEKHLIRLIEKNLRKEILPSTRQSIDLIAKDLETYYKSGKKFDVRAMRKKVTLFAANSHHQAPYCLKKVDEMVWHSDDVVDEVAGEDSVGGGEAAVDEKKYDDDRIVIFDTEVFINLFILCWKYLGEDEPVHRLINPTAQDIEMFIKMKLVGFNCRKYDNHILYARLMGWSNEKLYYLSQDLINNNAPGFADAKNLSYTDILDFSSQKKSLKWFENELGLHHQECPLPWDQPVPEDKWSLVADYCVNDVLATEAVWNDRKADWEARKFLSSITGLSVNTTTNNLTAHLIFGKDRNPQRKFNYRNLGDVSGKLVSYHYDDELEKMVEDSEPPTIDISGGVISSYTVFNEKGQPVFPGYSFAAGKSTYRGITFGKGGYVYSEPGMYWTIYLLDITSMHPSSVIAEVLFGEEGTRNYKELVEARKAVKHMDWEKARAAMGGALKPALEGIQERSKEEQEEFAENLSHALKIAINAVYGLTYTAYPNPFRDPRNFDNIVAQRGELFMINLVNEVQKRGYTVAHVKTDSIKIPNPDDKIVKFVMEYGKLYGYTFELESIYDRMCLVNKSVYVAYGKSGKHAGEWITVGTQFQDPYLKKTLFTKEPIVFKDYCKAKSVSTVMYLDMNENLPENEHNYVFVGRFGSFCPVKKGMGGGELMRKNGDSYDAVNGTKGFRWLESEVIKNLNMVDAIDTEYYIKDVNQAIKDISEYGDFEVFRSIN